MKKVLVIANLTHASPRVPGVTTYLPEYGWEATIITPPLGDNAGINLGFPKQFLERTRIVEAPYRGDIFWFWRLLFRLFGFKTSESITEQVKERAGVTSRRSFVDILLNWYQAAFAYPDTERTWRKPALKAARKILKNEHFDAILSSSPFPTSHMVAAEAKRGFGLPWLADFRDPWTQNQNYPYGFIRKHFETKLELRALSSADIMTAATPAYARKQEHVHKRPTTVVTNGFDPENVNSPPVDLAARFTITYTGTIYTGKQDPEKFFRALEKLVSKRIITPGDIEVRFYGSWRNWLENEIITHNLGSIVRQCGTVSRYKSWQRQRESHVLLLLNWEDPKEKGVYPSKLFEYLSARRPVLASGGFPKDDIERILTETKGGIYAPTIKEIRTSLLSFCEEYKSTGKVSYNGDLKEINKYSYREMARKFADGLNRIAAK